MKTSLLVLVIASLLFGCVKSDGGSATATIEGQDLSGAYRALEVRCYTDNTLSTVTARSSFDAASPTTNISISGNSFVSKNADSGCILTTSGRIVGNSTTQLLSFSGQTTTTSTAATCNQTTTFQTIIGGAIIPGSFNSVGTHNGTKADSQASYAVSPVDGSVWLFTVLQVQGSPSDKCFLIYLKL